MGHLTYNEYHKNHQTFASHPWNKLTLESWAKDVVIKRIHQWNDLEFVSLGPLATSLVQTWSCTKWAGEGMSLLSFWNIARKFVLQCPFLDDSQYVHVKLQAKMGGFHPVIAGWKPPGNNRFLGLGTPNIAACLGGPGCVWNNRWGFTATVEHRKLY